ncbi:MAG: c-type cytochrome domain-containing protein, partial [Pirellula sp.]
MIPSHLDNRSEHRLVTRVSSALLIFAVSMIASERSLAQESETEVRFSQDIQPLLARRCFACHGPDQAEAGLRLNSREQAIAKLESGHTAIAPGAPDQSEILKRIRSTDEADRMPPEGKPLTEREQKLIERWIAQGAEWKQHWAFEPLVKPEIPKT